MDTKAMLRESKAQIARATKAQIAREAVYIVGNLLNKEVICSVETSRERGKHTLAVRAEGVIMQTPRGAMYVPLKDKLPVYSESYEEA